MLTVAQILLYFIYRPKKSVIKDEHVEIAFDDNESAVGPAISPVVSFEPLCSLLAPLRSQTSIN